MSESRKEHRSQRSESSRPATSLRQPTTYRTEIQGKTLLVMLDALPAVPSASPVASARQPGPFEDTRDA